MSYTYHGTNDLIALPGRSVQTFPSGLVRVERSFVCRKDRVARFRNIIKVNEPMPFDDGSPAIDGLYIFPEPQEVVRDDGFVEFRVTAYGRTNETGVIEKNTFFSFVFFQNRTLDASGFEIEESVGVSQPSINESYIIKKVAPSDLSIDQILTPPPVENIAIYLQSSLRKIENSSRIYYIIPSQKTVETSKVELLFTELSSSNFGTWTEWTITYLSRGTVSRDTYV